jgi:molecular chaperone GrpE
MDEPRSPGPDGPGTAGGVEPPGDAEVEPAGSPEEALRAAREESEQLRDRWLRAVAELENFKRRTMRDRDEWNERRTGEIFEGLLRVRDDFERALAHAPEAPEDPVLSGVRLVHRHLVEFCERFGVTAFDSGGQPFDPQLHDAILQVPRSDVPPETVVEVAVPGYRLGDRVLRHAQVVVSTAPDGDA